MKRSKLWSGLTSTSAALLVVGLIGQNLAAANASYINTALGTTTTTVAWSRFDKKAAEAKLDQLKAGDRVLDVVTRPGQVFQSLAGLVQAVIDGQVDVATLQAHLFDGGRRAPAAVEHVRRELDGVAPIQVHNVQLRR